jgi:hypothetical protein
VVEQRQELRRISVSPLCHVLLVIPTFGGICKISAGISTCMCDWYDWGEIKIPSKAFKASLFFSQNGFPLIDANCCC